MWDNGGGGVTGRCQKMIRDGGSKRNRKIQGFNGEGGMKETEASVDKHEKNE